MIAALIYLIGLIAALIAIAAIGFQVPPIMTAVTSAGDAGPGELFNVILGQIVSLNWQLTTLLVGLLLMGFARIIMLLGSIDRSLRGQV